MMRDIQSAEDLQNQLNSAREELQELTLGLTEAQEAYQAISSERDRLAGEVQTYQEEINAKEIEAQHQLTHFNEQKEKAKRIVKAQQIKLKQKDSQAESDKIKLQEQAEELSTLVLETTKLRSEHLETNTNYETLKNEFEKLQEKSKSQVQSLYSQLQDMESKAMESERKCSKEEESSEMTNQQLEDALTTITKFRTQTAELQEALEEKENHLATKTEKIESLTIDVEQSNKANAILHAKENTYTEQIKILQDNISALEAN